MKTAAMVLVFIVLTATPFAAESVVLDEVLRWEGTIAEWEAQAQWSLVLTIVVIVLGALVAALQKLEGRSLKVTVVIMGCFISIATGIRPVLFPVEGTRLKANVVEGRKLAFEIRNLVASLENASPNDRKLINQEITNRLEAFYAIERSLVVSPATLPGESVAHAQGPPGVQASGEGKASTLQRARQNALEEAANGLAKRLQAVDPAWGDQYPVLLRAVVETSSQEVESSPRYDRRDGKWGYSVLLRLSETIARLELAEALKSFTLVDGATTFEVTDQTEVTVSATAADPKEAHFDFTFKVTREQNDVAVELQSLVTVAGASSGRGRWLFDVFLNDSRVLQAAENREYATTLGGSKGPEPSRRGVARAPGTTLTLRVQGARARPAQSLL